MSETWDMIDWDRIDDCFLDMDGTLLDLHFDNQFWLEHVPRRYAEARGLPLEHARSELLGRYRAIAGTLQWYCVDHWSEDLGLDILPLKAELEHLIRLRPHAIEFLEALGACGKRRVLVTNAHRKTLAFKLERTPLAGHFEAIVSAHDLGLPKEDPAFWTRLRACLPFDPQRTLFIDDNLNVLRAARTWGLSALFAIVQPDSGAPRRAQDEFPAIADFAQLLPALRFGYASCQS